MLNDLLTKNFLENFVKEWGTQEKAKKKQDTYVVSKGSAGFLLEIWALDYTTEMVLCRSKRTGLFAL
jgi:hypothetical protein